MIRRPPSPTLFPYPTLFRPPSAKSFFAPPDVAEWNPSPELTNLIDDAYIQWPHIHEPAFSGGGPVAVSAARSEEHTSELQSRPHLVCRLLLEKKNRDVLIHP